MKLHKTTTILYFVLFTLFLAACGSSTETPDQSQATSTNLPASGESLPGTRWALISMGKPGQEAPVIEGSNVTLEFGEDGQVGGSGGCNSYGGKYKADGETITILEIESTLMACAEALVTNQETQYLQALGSASRYTLADNRLSIVYDDEQNVLNFVPLEASSTSPTQPPVITDAGLIPTGRDEKQYTITAESGQNIMIEVTSDGAPLSLTIATPSGIQRFPEVTQDGSGFRISHSFVASETGEYRLTLSKADQTPSTNYTATFAVQ